MTQTNIEQDIIDDAIKAGFNSYSQNNELSLDFDKALLIKLSKFAQLQRERQASVEAVAYIHSNEFKVK